jgi:hypothetical protein
LSKFPRLLMMVCALTHSLEPLIWIWKGLTNLDI